MAVENKIAKLLSKIAARGIKLSKAQIDKLDGKALQELANAKTSPERTATLLGKKAPAPAKAPAKAPVVTTKRTPTPSTVRKNKAGGRVDKAQLFEKDLAKLTNWQKKVEAGEKTADEFMAEFGAIAKKYGMDSNELGKKLKTTNSSADVLGARMPSEVKTARAYREQLVKAGEDKDLVGRAIFSEEKFANVSDKYVPETVGTRQQYRPAQSRQTYAVIELTPAEAKLAGTKRITGAGKTHDEAFRNAKELYNSTVDVSPSKGKVTEKGVGQQTTAIARRGEGRGEAPVKTVKGDRVLTPQTTAVARRGDMDLVPSRRRAVEEVPYDDVTPTPKASGSVESPTPKAKMGMGRKLATGVAAATGLGIGAAALQSGQQGGARTRAELQKKKALEGSVGSIAKTPENAAASGEVDAEESAPSVTIPEAQFKKDIVDYVHTKGGDYPIFRKNSDSAMTWRNTYATAKKNGESTFTFNGLKYKV